MSRGQQKFKQGDVTKALKATVKAGITVGRVEIDKDGKIVIVTGRELLKCQRFDFHQRSSAMRAVPLTTRRSTISTLRCEASCWKCAHQAGRRTISGIRTSEAESGSTKSAQPMC